MDQKISVRLPPDAAEYLAKLQVESGGSLSDLVRDLVEQARQRNQAGEPTGHLSDVGKAELVHEVCRYTASLLTALVRTVATDPTEADQMIQKAIADAAQVSRPGSVSDTETEED